MATFGLGDYDVGMVKVSVLYPNVEGGRFDMDYFVCRHLPLVDRVWGAALIRREIDAGLAGPGPGTRPTYVAMAHLYFESIESFQAALGPQHKELEKEAPEFTDITPIIQVSNLVRS
jgi:uncharacterized protein (TIGR02118 family)